MEEYNGEPETGNREPGSQRKRSKENKRTKQEKRDICPLKEVIAMSKWPVAFGCILVILVLLHGPARSQGSKPQPLSGTYSGKQGTLEVLQLAGTQLKVHLSVFWKDHVGEVCGAATFEKNIAVYKREKCTLILRFVGKRVQVTQRGTDADCDFGANVTAQGSYQKTSRKPPKITCD